MANDNDDHWLSGDDPVLVRATFTKETKTTYRYDIQENDYGIGGCLYIKQPEANGGKKQRPPKTLKVKVKPVNK